MMHDSGFEVDSLRQSRSDRLPYKHILAFLVVGLLFLSHNVSAETLKVVSNTDICKYDANLGLDKCKTIYELCDPVLDMKKVNFQFMEEKEKTFKSQIDNLSYNYTSKIGKTNCRTITIEALKNPFKNIDNVLCYGSNCHEEFIWWNSSFISKFNITASTNSGEVTMPVLVNDGFFTIEGKPQHVWCNYTLNTTRQIVGYMYFTNASFYQCVDRTETFAVGMQVDNGNNTLVSANPFDKDMIVGSHLTKPLINAEDSSIYGRNCTKAGNPQTINAQISKGADLDSVGDYYDCGDIDTYINDLTLMIWVNFNSLPNNNMPMISKWTGAGFQPFMLNVIRSGSGSNPLRPQIQGGSGFATGTTIMQTGVWTHITGTRNDTHWCIFVDGSLESCRAATGNLSFNNIPIEIGHDTAGNAIDAKIDEYRIYNRTLTSDEIRVIYENMNGTFGIASPIGPIINLSLNVSVNHFDIDIPSFLVTSQSYQTIVNSTFTLVDARNLVIKGSASARKQNGGGSTSFVSSRLIFNGITLFDEDVRSIKGTSDRGIFTFPIKNMTGNAGTNTIVLQFKRTTNDDINISNLAMHIDTNISNNGFFVPIELETVSVNYTSTIYVNIANFTMNKTSNSTVLIDVDHKFQSTSNNTATDCHLESSQSGERTLTYSRWMQSSGDVGSSGTNYRSQTLVRGPEEWMLFCRSSTNNMILNNVTVYIMNQQNIINDTIKGFQESDSAPSLTGSGNVILSRDYRNAQGRQLEILTTIIMQSISGSQDGGASPVFRVRTNDSVCNSTFERSLSGNSDIGTAKVYVNCEGITPGQLKSYEVVVDVATGETLNILNVSMSTYETTQQLVIPGVVSPVVIITDPENATTITETITIEAIVIDLSITGWASIVNVFNSSNDLVSNLLNETSTENTTSTNFNTRALINGNYTIEWIVFNDVGNNNDNVSVFISNIFIPAPPSITFCANDQLLLQRESSSTTINGNVTIEVVDELIYCNYGCNNWTLLQFGNPGCIEGDYILSIMFIIFLIIFVLILRGAVK